MRGPAVRGVISLAVLALTAGACSVSATRTTSGTSGAAMTAPSPTATAPARATAQDAQQSAVQPIGGRAGSMLTSGMLVGNTLYLSGQLPGRAARDSGIGPQTKSAIAASQAILKQAGMDLPNVVAVTVYITDVADFAAMNTAYMEMFTTDPRPTRTTVVAGLVSAGAKIEVTMVAVRK